MLTTDLRRFAISSLGALILSTACIMAAVGPANAAPGEASATAVRVCPQTIARLL